MSNFVHSSWLVTCIHSHKRVPSSRCTVIIFSEEKQGTKKKTTRKPWPFGRFVKTFLFFNPIARAFSQEVAVSGSLPDPGVRVRSLRLQLLTRLEKDMSPLSGRVVLVIGATGRVGRQLIVKLQHSGCKVRALVRDENRAIAILKEEGAQVDKLELITGDLHSLVPEHFRLVYAVFCVMGVALQPNTFSTSSAPNAMSSVDSNAEWKLYTELVEYEGVKNLVSFAQQYLEDAVPVEKQDVEYLDIFPFRPPASNIPRLWGPVDDVVMGGVSQSKIELSSSGDSVIFSGQVSTDNFGGFASVKTIPFETPLDLSGYDGIYLRLLGDGRRYKFIIRCDKKWDGIAYICSMDTVASIWKECYLPFSQFRPVFRAKTITPISPLDPTTIYSFQLMYSKFEYDEKLNPSFQEGPFSLELKDIYAYRHNELGTKTPQFVYLSAALMEYLLSCKYRAEQVIRSSTLRYTIVRPCAMYDGKADKMLLTFVFTLFSVNVRAKLLSKYLKTLMEPILVSIILVYFLSYNLIKSLREIFIHDKRLGFKRGRRNGQVMNFDALTLYYEPGSPPCRAVLMFLLENGIPHKIHRIKLFEKDHLKPEYQSINPFQKVPAIQDGDGFFLAESHAILKYLFRTRASMIQEHWYPSDPQKRAKIDELLDWHHSSLSWSTKLTVWNAVMVAKFMNQPQSSLSTLESILGNGPFVIKGMEQPSIADLSLFVEIENLRLLPSHVLYYIIQSKSNNSYLSSSPACYFSLSEYPHICQWLDRMKRLKSYSSVHQSFEKVVAMLQKTMMNNGYAKI
ncbi:Glutathione S-transferase T1 [Galdieria sulphuraria]|nr:Glutathione S-transferase T1 [Galdieria sulphuraria]